MVVIPINNNMAFNIGQVGRDNLGPLIQVTNSDILVLPFCEGRATGGVEIQ